MAIFALAIYNNSCCQGQGISNNWLMGYSSNAGVPFGQTRIDFNTGTPIINYDSIEMDFNHTHANISDTLGNMLFYTNGYYIADATDDTMQNGTEINPGQYADDFSFGLLIPQGALILQKPNSSNIYYLFHNTLDNYPSPGSYSFNFYVTTIDMTLNNGKGAVVSKNVSLINDSMNVGKISACKHANGRDWWVVVHRVNSNIYYKLLVTPYGIFGPYSQNIGSYREWDGGQAKFSPDGSRYAYFHYRFTGLDVFDFDRCTGDFSNWRNDSVPLEIGNVGCAFSPNSNVLYIGNITKVYQYNCTDSNLLTSKMIVADWDSFKESGSLGTYLCYPELASDGKIYITTGNGTHYLHCINNPDSIGLGCNVAQHSIQLPAYYFNTLPNHPNYFLGKITGGPCDTVPLNNAIEDPPPRILKVMPNPTTGIFTLWFNVHDKAGWIEIYNVNGLCIRKVAVAQWSQYRKMDISNEPQGVYLCRMRWGERSVSVKIIKE